MHRLASPRFLGSSRNLAAPTRPARGFTLLEALIVVAIIGILAALSIGAFHVLIPRWRLQAAGNELDSVIKRARLIAIQRRETIEIRFEDDAGAAVPRASMAYGQIYTLVASDDDDEEVARSPLFALASGVEVDANTFTDEVIRFDSLGQSASTGEIAFGYPTSPTTRRRLTVSIRTVTGNTDMLEEDI